MNALIEQFDLLATSTGGIAKLRELILSLAVRGQLVPQDPTDEPASELLKKIRAEKDRLIAEGKIKRDKPLAEIGEDEKPYELPEGWEWTRLGHLAGLENGDRSSNYPSKGDFVPVGIPFVNAGHLSNGMIDHSEMNFISAERYNQLRSGKILAGDILYCLRGSLGKMALAQEGDHGAIASSLVIVRRVSGLQAKYAMLYFSSPLAAELIGRFDNGTAQPNLGAADLRKFVVPLPPLAEQARIVAKVEELMALCDRLEAEQGHAARVQGHWVEAALDQLAESTDADEFRRHWQHLAEHFDALFTTPASIDKLNATLLQLAVRGKLVAQDPSDEPASELLKQIRAEKDRLILEGKIKRDKPLPPITDDEKPYELPEGWEWVRLETIADIGTGTTPSRAAPEYWNPGEIPWVASGETGNPFISETAESVSRFALTDTSLRLYPAHTLVIALYGQGKTRGQISELLIEATTNQACAAIVPIVGNPEHKEYIKQYFRKMYEEIREEAAGGAQPNLNVGKIKSVLIPLPPLAEQFRIVAQVEKLLALTAELKVHLSAAQTKQAHLAETLIAEVC